MTLRIQTKSGAFFDVLDTGDIKRLDQPGFVPSGQWKLQAIRRRRGARCLPGNRECYMLSALRRAYGQSHIMPEEKPTLLHKNGSPVFTVVDLDHGTTREWGDGVVAVWKV